MWVERNGPTWRVRDRIAGRKATLGEGYPTEGVAENARTLFAADKLRGDALVPRGGRVTLDEVIDLWWPAYVRALKPSAEQSEAARVRNHIRPLLGSHRLDEIDTATVNQWIEDLTNGVGPMGEPVPGRRRTSTLKRIALAPKTVHNAHGVLFMIMKFAIAQKLRRDNPCASSTLPARVHREMRVLTDPEIGRLVAALPEHWRPLIVLLVATGLRWGEAIGLKVGRVDLLAKRPSLRVEQQLQDISSRGLVWVSPKTIRSRRTVTFTKAVALVLTGLVAAREDGEVVFTTPTGRMIRTSNFRRVWLAALKRAGLEGLRVHDLRHTHAAILLSAGVPIEKISRRLGHSTIAVTDAVYGHLRKEADDEVIAAIDDAIKSLGSDELAVAVADELVDEL